MDRFYTSLAIDDCLLEQGITIVGTMTRSGVGSPAEIKDITNREINSTEIFWEENCTKCMLSYVLKISKGKNNFIILSTVHPLLGVTTDVF